MSDWRIFKILTDIIMRFVLAKIGFWSGNMYDVAIKGDAHVSDLTLNNDTVKWFVILGRGSYFETVKDYPIGRLRDLKDILKNEPWRYPFPGLLQQKIERLSDQSHRVTTWVIKQEVLDNMTERPLWIVPESACLMRLAISTIVSVDRLDELVYVSIAAGRLISSVGLAQSFFLNVGANSVAEGSPAIDEVRLSSSDAVGALAMGVWNNIKVTPIVFFCGFNGGALGTYSWRVVAGIFSSVVLSYLVLSSIYLVIMNTWVDIELEGDLGEAQVSAAVRRDLKAHRDKADEMASIFSEIQPLWVAWDIMLDMTETGVVFRAVNSKPPEVIFYLTAQRATDVLAWLSEDPRVESNEVTLPVRKVIDGEQFAVSITLNNVHHDSMTPKVRLLLDEPASAKTSVNTNVQ